jgi:predicted enzyme related to lactoylglutathione lyase
MSYLSVSDVDSAYKAALAAGAKSLVAPMDYGSVGRAATIADPTGGVFSLWRGNQGDPPEVETTPAGGFIWNELATKDEKMALAFYEKVFGFTYDEMPMPEGAYFVLKQAEKSRAGLYKAMHASMPTSWTPYVCVADCDQTTELAKSLGANAVVPPSDIPGVGRLAMFVDPQGAMFAILKPSPSMS